MSELPRVTNDMLEHTTSEVARLSLPDADTDTETVTQYMASLLPVQLRNTFYVNFSASPENPNAEHVFDFIERRVLDLGTQLPPGSQILTLGAGDAEMEINLVQKGLWASHITATDMFDHFIKARDIAEKQGITNISFETADARRLPYADNVADLVVAPFFIYHVDHPELVTKEMYRVAKPGAKGIISSRGADNMKSLWDAMQIGAEELNKFTTVGFQAPQSWYHNCDPGATRRLLEESGFQNIKTIFLQRSPEDFLYIPLERWDDIRLTLLAWKDSFRPVPPTIADFMKVVDGPIYDGFRRIAEENDGMFPLEVDQEVFEFEKPLELAA